MSVDVHSHVVPSTLPDMRDLDERSPLVERDGAAHAHVVVGGKAFRRIDARCWDAGRRLDDMSSEGVGMQVLSPMPELLSYWVKPHAAAKLASSVNAMIADLCARHPQRFMGLGMVTLQDPALAVRQLCGFRAMGLSGVEIGTHVDGLPLGSETLWEFYAALAEEGLALFVHPLHPAGCERVGGAPVVAAVAAFPMEIAFAATSLMTAGIPVKLPGLRILLSHGGGALALVAARLAAAAGYTDTVGRHFGESPLQTLSRFWFDSNVYDPELLRHLAARAAPGRILVGSDYPFEIRQPEPVRFCCEALNQPPEHFRDAALRFLGLKQGTIT